MKFCPKCGNQLPDDAMFCNKCGAPQPGMEAPKEEAPVREETPLVNASEVARPAPTPVAAAATPRERFNYLMENDEDFRCIVKATKKSRFLNLINLLFIVPWLVCMFTPIGMFLGGMDSAGDSILQTLGGIPYSYSVMTLRPLITAAGKYSLTPGNGLNNPMGLLAFIFGFIWIAFMVLMSILGVSNGQILKIYEGPDGKRKLIQNSTRNTAFLHGPVYSFFSLCTAFVYWFNSKDLNYSNGKNYLYGPAVAIDTGLITCAVVVGIFIVIMIVPQIVLKIVIFRKVRQIKL